MMNEVECKECNVIHFKEDRCPQKYSPLEKINTTDKCKNCGKMDEEHQSHTNKCPATIMISPEGGFAQLWSDTVFEAGDQEISISDAVNKLRKSLLEDYGYFQAWRANIAVAFIDYLSELESIVPKARLKDINFHSIANKSAIKFLDSLIGDIMTKETKEDK